MGGHYPMTELRRNASVPSLGLPRQMPRSMSMCLPPGKRAFAAETEGVQSWDEYQSIRDAQAARRPAARRCLENTLEIAARARSFPLTRGYSRRGETSRRQGLLGLIQCMHGALGAQMVRSGLQRSRRQT